MIGREHMHLGLLLYLLCAQLLLALDVQDVAFQQSTDGSKQVLVTYTLVGDSADVGLYLSLDGGQTFEHLRVGVSGERGPGIAPGSHAMTLDLTMLDTVVTANAALKVSAFRWPGGIRVPAGTFTMGTDDYIWASPAHEVTLSQDFYIGRNAVSNREFIEILQWKYDTTSDVTVDGIWISAYSYHIARVNTTTSPLQFVEGVFSAPFVTSGTYQGQPATDHPAVDMTWHGAAIFCDWKSEREGLEPFYQGIWVQTEAHNPYRLQGYRLPTEAEFERAAKYPDDRLYAWGEALPDCEIINFLGCIGGTSPIGRYPLGNSFLGVSEMASNVSNLVGDCWLSTYEGSSTIDPLGPAGFDHLEKGCRWLDSSNFTFTYFRVPSQDSGTGNGTGFRMAKISE